MIVTGANSGLGLVTARELARVGRQDDPGRAQHRQGRRSRRHHDRRRRGPQARPAGPGVGARVRRRRRRCRRAGQQRRHHGGAVRADRRRLREPDRHQPPRPLRADQPAAAQDHRAGGDGVVADAPDGLHQPQGPELEVAAVLGVAGLRAVQAGQPAVHQGAAAPPRRRGVESEGARRAPRLLGHQPAVALGRRLRQGLPDRQLAGGHRRRLRRPPDALRRLPGPAGRQLHRPPVRHAGPTGPTGLRSPLARDAKKATALWELSEQLTDTKFAL